MREVKTGEQLRELARPIVSAWARSAVMHGEEHYRQEFQAALAGASVVGSDGLPGRSRSLAEVLEEDEDLRAQFDEMWSEAIQWTIHVRSSDRLESSPWLAWTPHETQAYLRRTFSRESRPSHSWKLRWQAGHQLSVERGSDISHQSGRSWG
jgi:hypothetical protein